MVKNSALNFHGESLLVSFDSTDVHLFFSFGSTDEKFINEKFIIHFMTSFRNILWRNFNFKYVHIGCLTAK
jgi:hypothetical protein